MRVLHSWLWRHRVGRHHATGWDGRCKPRPFLPTGHCGAKKEEPRSFQDGETGHKVSSVRARRDADFCWGTTEEERHQLLGPLVELGSHNRPDDRYLRLH